MAANSLPDPLGAAQLTAQNLAIWAQDPGRLHEDLTSESELAHVGYRGRVVTELLQNAADAIDHDGVVEIRLFNDPAFGPTLDVANTGKPLDADGLTALTALRRSSKRDPQNSLGHFGVGFASVLSVSDRPHIGTAATLIAFDAERTQGAAGHDGPVPVLRTPFVVAGQGLANFATTVRLPLRDVDAICEVRQELSNLGDWVLVAMPSLTSVTIRDQLDDCVDPVTIEHVDQRWEVVRSNGTLPTDVVSELPQHRQHRNSWNVAWAFPKRAQSDRHGAQCNSDALQEALASLGGTSSHSGESRPMTGAGSLAGHGSQSLSGIGFIGAPTPTKERFDWPVGLTASFPISEDRQHIVDGPVTDYLIDQAAKLFVEHVAHLAQQRHSWWHHLPAAAGRHRIGLKMLARIEELLADAQVIVEVDGLSEETEDTGSFDNFDSLDTHRRLLRPAEATFLAHPQLASDDDFLKSLPVSGMHLAQVPSTHHECARRIGLLGLPLNAMLRKIELPGIAPGSIQSNNNTAAQWGDLYHALSEHRSDPDVREALAELPVPLADGRVVHGPRGCLLVPPSTDKELHDMLLQSGKLLGLRLVSPEVASHDACLDILLHAGVQRFTALEFLERPELRNWVRELHNNPDGEELPVLHDDLVAQEERGSDPSSRDAESHCAPWQVCFKTVCLALEQHGSHVADRDVSPELDFRGVGAANVALTGTDPAAMNPIADLFGQVLLPDEYGEPCPAGELIRLSGNETTWFDPELCSRLDEAVTKQFSPETLSALGVTVALSAANFTLVDLADPPPGLLACDGFDEWGEETAAGVAAEVTVIQGLEFVAPAHWPSVLREVADSPELLEALARNVEVQGHDGHTRTVLGFSLWWLRRELDLVGTTSHPCLEHWLKPAPKSVKQLPPSLLTLLGVATGYNELNAECWQAILDSLGEEDVCPESYPLAECWYFLSQWVGGHAGAATSSSTRDVHDPSPSGAGRFGTDLPELNLPDFVWIPTVDGPAYVETADLVASPERSWHFHPDAGPLLPAAGQAAELLAEALDVPLWSDLDDTEKPAGLVHSVGQRHPLPELLVQRLSATTAATSYLLCSELTVDETSVAWWADTDNIYVTSAHHLLEAVALLTDDACNAAGWTCAARGDTNSEIWGLLAPDNTAFSETIEPACPADQSNAPT